MRRRPLSLFGKMETTLVRRRICLLRFSSLWEVLRRRRTCSGKLNGADVGCDGKAHGELGDVGLGVLLEVELATLPGAGWKDGFERGFESFVGIAGDGFWEGEAAFFETEMS
ncbi:MAG: hypothetical protein ACI8UZ_003430 [Akkermansiaceae bacterium]|jgi:hypothetical protein